jgi:hypothetical protein
MSGRRKERLISAENASCGMIIVRIYWVFMRFCLRPLLILNGMFKSTLAAGNDLRNGKSRVGRLESTAASF